MITNQEDLAARPPMRFEQTVNRELVHKWALAEVFLTDYAEAGDSRYACAAQLPISHSYFNDHTEGADVIDPLLLLEVGRQVATIGAYLHCGVPRSAVLVLANYVVDLPGPALALPGVRPPELVAVTSAATHKTRARRPGSLSFTTEFSLAGDTMGTVGMLVTWMTGDQYRALRRMRRGGNPPTAFECDPVANGAPVDPETVRRRDPANVAIGGLSTAGRQRTAYLDTGCYLNPAMFDHPYDHVPAMVLTEAARQLAVVTTGTTTDRIRSLRGRFDSFAELDSPVLLTAIPAAGGSVEVSLTQAGRLTAEIAVIDGRKEESI